MIHRVYAHVCVKEGSSKCHSTAGTSRDFRGKAYLVAKTLLSLPPLLRRGGTNMAVWHQNLMQIFGEERKITVKNEDVLRPRPPPRKNHRFRVVSVFTREQTPCWTYTHTRTLNMRGGVEKAEMRTPPPRNWMCSQTSLQRGRVKKTRNILSAGCVPYYPEWKFRILGVTAVPLSLSFLITGRIWNLSTNACSTTKKKKKKELEIFMQWPITCLHAPLLFCDHKRYWRIICTFAVSIIFGGAPAIQNRVNRTENRNTAWGFGF